MDHLVLLAFDIRDQFEGDKFETALSWLPSEEQVSVTRFKFERDRHLGLASKLLRRHHFSELLNIPWFELEFEQLQGGKPKLKGHKLIDYNISHDGYWVILASTDVPQLRIGVDTVTLDHPHTGYSIDSFIRNFDFQLSKSELQLIFSSNHHEEMHLQTFYEVWGCKESYIKAIGVGLNLELKKLDFVNEKQQV